MVMNEPILWRNGFSKKTVKSWFGVDIAAERAAKHRATELRKLKQRQKGTKTHYTRTKGVLYNGS